MRAISLWQPWASLVAIGAKRIETRSWSTPYRGPLAIHAAKRMTREEAEIILSEPFRSEIVKGGYRRGADLPLGAIVAVVTVTDCLPITANPVRGCRSVALDDEGIVRDWRPQLPVMEHVGIGEDFGEHERDFGDYSPGRFAWVLADVTRLPEPIPYRGHQGLWNLEPEIVEKVRVEAASD